MIEKAWKSTTFIFTYDHCEQIYKLLKSNKGHVSAVFEIMWDDPCGFGNYERDSAGAVLRLIEKIKAINVLDFEDVWKELREQ